VPWSKALEASVSAVNQGGNTHLSFVHTILRTFDTHSASVVHLLVQNDFSRQLGPTQPLAHVRPDVPIGQSFAL
jgi:hypothetical protein